MVDKRIKHLVMRLGDLDGIGMGDGTGCKLLIEIVLKDQTTGKLIIIDFSIV